MWFLVKASWVLGWITEFCGLSLAIFGNILARSMIIHICLLFILHSFTKRVLGIGGFLQLTAGMVRLGFLAVFICSASVSVRCPEACTNLLEDAIPAQGNFHSASRATRCGKSHQKSYENKTKGNHISHSFPELCKYSKTHQVLIQMHAKNAQYNVLIGLGV